MDPCRLEAEASDKTCCRGREGDDGEESGGRDEERKEVSVFQLLVFLRPLVQGRMKARLLFLSFFLFYVMPYFWPDTQRLNQNLVLIALNVAKVSNSVFV